MKNEDTMSYEDNSRLFILKCDSKRGVRLNEADQAFVQRMYDLYPKQFGELESSVFEATRPVVSVSVKE